MLSAHSSPTEVNRTRSVLYVYTWADTQMTQGLMCVHQALTKLSRGYGGNAKEIFAIMQNN